MANLDAFERLRVSSPEPAFDASFQYDLQPLLFEQAATGDGTAVTGIGGASAARVSLNWREIR